MSQIAHHPKSVPLAATPGPLPDIAQRGWHLLDDDLAYPIAVLRRSALMHNLRWMARPPCRPNCLRCSLALAPGA